MVSRRALVAALISLGVCATGVSLLDSPRWSTLRAACAAGALTHDCNVVFVEQTNAAFRQLAHLVFEVEYPTDKLDFGESPVACSVYSGQVGVDGIFTNDRGAGKLRVELSRDNGLFPDPLVVCSPLGSDDAQSAVLGVSVVEARDGVGQPLSPTAVVAVETFECTTTTLSATTTTLIGTTTTAPPTSSSMTTTTTVPPAPCGDANGDGRLTASDALAILRGAVGLDPCPAPVCDTDANGFVNTSDALRVLHVSVGIDETLTCV